jgi:methionine-gamma-lyase
MRKRWSAATLAIHPRQERTPGPVVTPIVMSSTFRLRDARQGGEFTRTVAPKEYYTRWGNPTAADLEDTVAQLEGGAKALATGSGMGAIAPAILTFVESGGTVVAGKSPYAATAEIFEHLLPKFGVRTTWVDPRRPGAFEEAVDSETDLVYVETPANPTMMITDLHEAVKAARSVGATVLADNTFATPINQRPIEFGADVVLHSATKYLGGHADVIAGVAVTRTRPLFDKVWYTYKLLGPTIGPVEAFLVRRGIKTLPLRVRQQNRSATLLAEHLDEHRAVSKVHYPGLRSFDQHRLARRQMDGFGGMLSFEPKGGYRAGLRFVEAVELATLAVSLGGAETLVEHPASMTHGTLNAKERDRMGINEGLVRVSVGLEDPDELIEDFDRALRKAKK